MRSVFGDIGFVELVTIDSSVCADRERLYNADAML